MPHVDHRTVDPVFLLVSGDHLREVVPQGAHRVFLLGQSGIVVPEGIVRHVVVLVFRIAVHAQVGYVVPRRLDVVRRPVGKSGRDDGFAFGSLSHRLPFEAFYFVRREGEHLPVLRAGGEVVFLPTRGGGLPDALELFGGEAGLFEAVGILTVDPVEPLGVRRGLDAVHRGGPQGKFQHDADAQDVGGFHQGGELVGDAHPLQQRVGQQRVEVQQVGGGVRRAEVAFAVGGADAVDGQQVQGVGSQGADIGEHGDGLEEGAAVADAFFVEGQVDLRLADDVVAVVVEGAGQAREGVVKHRARTPSVGLAPDGGEVGGVVHARSGLFEDADDQIAVVVLGPDKDVFVFAEGAAPGRRDIDVGFGVLRIVFQQLRDAGQRGGFIHGTCCF